VAFNVSFYQFNKKSSSTATPTGAGQTYACLANEPLDVLEPVIRLELAYTTQIPISVYNYARIPAFERWYWITGWTLVDGLWEARLRVDPLASWKSQIGSCRCYVFRAASSYTNRLTDNLYPQLCSPHRLTINLPKVWSVGGASSGGGAADEVNIVAGIVSSGGTRFYAMSPTNWQRFFTKLFSDDFYDDVLGVFGAQEYPEAKVAVNPLQYITSCIMVPLSISSSVRYCINYVNSVTAIPVGTVTVTPVSGFTAYYLGDATDLWTAQTQLGSDFWHPQADDRGDWLNYSPATEYSFFFPPVGEIPLEPSLIEGADYIRWELRPDYKANTALLEITSEFTSPARSYPLYRGEIGLGVSVPLSNIVTPGSPWKGAEYIRKNAEGMLGDLVSLASNLPVVGGLTSKAVSSAVHGAIPKLTITGGFATLATMGGQPRLIVTHWLYANDDLDGRGRPLGDVRQLSTLSGYIQADPDEIHVSCTATELAEIQSAVAAGFFYE
jgi:hypothetical protein